MAKQNPKSNTTPLIIIGLVFLAMIAGGYWLYSQSQARPTNPTNVNGTPPPNGGNQTDIYATAPPGAQPPHTLGSPTATVIVEEFADFQCPTCASVHGIMKQVNSLYGSRIRFVFRNFPLVQIHPNATNAAAAAEAASMQGKFWEMQNLLFVNQKEWSTQPDAPQIFQKYAETLGLDVEKFKTDVVSLPVRQRINNDVSRGRALRLTGTPSIFINGKSIPFQQMTVAGLSGIIDAELKAAQNKKAE